MFICDCCGLCCKNLGNSSIYKDLDRGDGVCKFFNEGNNLCNIYDKRPDKCNVDRMFELYFKDSMSKEEYYKLNYLACNKFKEEGKGICI